VALDVFGRCSREAACAPTAVDEGGLPRALHLINGATLNAKLKSEEGRVARWAASTQPESALIEEMYLRALARFPTPEESTHWSAAVRAAAARRQLLEDLLWALLNSREFAFNH
jgi:hypothetical protein